MNAKLLYKKLDADFQIVKCKDDWSEMDFNEFIAKNFKKRYMGLMLDSTKEINQCCTAVFPSDHVLNKILNMKKRNVLLFLHHPMIWDISSGNYPFSSITKDLLAKLKENGVSIYALHVPLDKNGEYSTAVSLAKAIGIRPEKEFCEYFGVKVGIIGKTKYKKIGDLAKKVKSAVGHRIKLWNYGLPDINGNKVALVAGGGNNPKTIASVADLNINTFITGVTKPNKDYPPSMVFHNIAKEKKINIIGATHYSTEKFACISIIDYFKKIRLPAKFIEDKPSLSDIE